VSGRGVRVVVVRGRGVRVGVLSGRGVRIGVRINSGRQGVRDRIKAGAR
jgi:hypothetical protein